LIVREPRLALFLLVFMTSFAASAGAQEKKPLPGWGDFVDPAGDCKVRAEKDRVTITVPGTNHNLNPIPEYDNVLGPRLLQAVDGNFDVQVQAAVFPQPKANTSTTPQKHSYVAAGLLVWQDDKTFLRCLRAALGERGEVFVHVEAFQGGKRLDGRYFVTAKTRVIPDQAVFLRVERRGKQLTASQSLDGKKWTQHGRFTFSTLPESLRVGVGAVNATTAEFAPQLEELKLTKK
jgi:regulation of enolase protein 1 (concanavalin A-like superfamily)